MATEHQLHLGSRVRIEYPGYWEGTGTVEGFVPGGVSVYIEEGDDAGKQLDFSLEYLPWVTVL